MMTAPALTASEAFNNKAAVRPARRFGNRRLAASYNSTDPAAAANGASRRTPIGCSPASSVPARIHNATIGG